MVPRLLCTCQELLVYRLAIAIFMPRECYRDGTPRCTRVHTLWALGQERGGERFCRLDDPGRARTPSSELPKVVPAMAEDGDEQIAPNLE